MSEILLSWSVFLRIMSVALFATLYSLGGRNGKWIRRYLGPAVFIASITAMSVLFGTFSWFHLIPMVLLPVVLTFGYSTPSERFIYGLGFGLYGLLMGIFLGYWELGVLQAILAVVASIWLGLRNPIEASLEEGLIATLSVVCIPFMI